MYTFNKLNKEGYSFKIIDQSEVDFVIVYLKNISDAWLDLKNSSEKNFSLENFEKDYIKNFKIGVIKKNEKIIAFSNIWETFNKNELSVDLMSYKPYSPNSVMEFLFPTLSNYDYIRLKKGEIIWKEFSWLELLYLLVLLLGNYVLFLNYQK
ncbi:phosphatidylglycerol lysyltransferase domain-containing protein [uncultured Ilyobacter sp.]|uniref:phosphatidylglycerol lysyltransferase domain-containing protein n=1 Tax=uncultured Ilyobacter sp. TaxID=544433 RepID=UPI0029C7D735|nr:phosphatidylglycerol lysyltransferase domain-containing protein [uncultured Ilyobacter sp.]